MTDVRTLRSVTHLFPTFLGLRLLPIGLWFLVASIPALGVFPSRFHLVLLVLSVGAIWPIHLWYRGHYGVVESQTLRFGRNWALLVGLVAAYLALGFGASVIGLRPLVLLLVLILFGAGVFFALPRPFPGSRPAVGLLLAVAGLCGLLLFTLTREPAKLGSMGGLLSLSIGVVLCLAGVVEHRLLGRAIEKSRGNGGA